MRKVELEVFNLRELKLLYPDGFKRAYDNFVETFDYPDVDDTKTAREFVKVLPFIKFDYNDQIVALLPDLCDKPPFYAELVNSQGKKLYEILKREGVIKAFTNGDEYTKMGESIKCYSCPLTGFTLDDDYLYPFWEWLSDYENSPLKYFELITQCLKSGKDAEKEMRNEFFSEENFIDMSESNEWEYLKTGILFIS
jgi:hypothetical protein